MDQKGVPQIYFVNL